MFRFDYVRKCDRSFGKHILLQLHRVRFGDLALHALLVMLHVCVGRALQFCHLHGIALLRPQVYASSHSFDRPRYAFLKKNEKLD